VSANRPHRSVLIVDGDAQFAAQVAAHLGQSGIQAKLASDGYDAVRAVQMRAYDLVVLGMQLRDRDGAEVLRLLRLDPHTANTPVHLLAAHGESEILNSAMRVGAQGVFRRDQQSPDQIAFEIVSLLGGATPGAQPQAVVGPARSVPADVDAMARRFRGGQRSSSAAHPASASVHGGGGALPEGFHRASQFAPSQLPPEAAATVQQRRGAPPRPVGRTQVGGAGRFGTQHGDSPLGSESTSLPSASSHGTAANAPPRAPHAPTQQVFSYDTLLNHLVGQAPYLAEAMGLRTDFLCATCGAQLTLRLWPDGERANGVRGYFFCDRCEPQ